MKFKSEKVPASIHFIITAAFVVAVVFLGVFFFTGTDFVPDDFAEARINSAAIAKDIVALTEESLGNLEKIAAKDRQYDFGGALVLVEGELMRVGQAQMKAVELTNELGIMALSAVDIRPKKARDLAIEAISHEVALISRLMIYNDSLQALLQTLEYKFSGDIRYDAEDVQMLVKNMNEDAKEINNLNALFKEKMDHLDEVVE